MRRKDREMSREFGLKIIDKARFGVLSMVSEDGMPYGVPLSIVRDGNTLYFHSARAGRKVKTLAGNPGVSITFVGEVDVPGLYTKEVLDEIVKQESKSELLTSNVFTTEFESVIVTGGVRLVEDEQERLKGMRLICEKFTPAKMDYFDAAVKFGLGVTAIYAVEIEGIETKRKKYDSSGTEMKWGRM